MGWRKGGAGVSGDGSEPSPCLRPRLGAKARPVGRQQLALAIVGLKNTRRAKLPTMWPGFPRSRRRSTRQHNMPRRACIPAAEAQQVAARGCLAEARCGRLIPPHQLAHAALSSLGPAFAARRRTRAKATRTGDRSCGSSASRRRWSASRSPEHLSTNSGLPMGTPKAGASRLPSR